MVRRRRFTATFEARVALVALREDRALQQMASQHGMHPSQVSHWKRRAREGLVGVFNRRPSADAQRSVEAAMEASRWRGRLR